MKIKTLKIRFNPLMRVIASRVSIYNLPEFAFALRFIFC